MKTFKDLTPEIRSKIPEYISKVRDNLYNGNEHKTNKRSDTVSYIEKVYDIAKRNKPVVILAKDPRSFKIFQYLIFKNKEVQRNINLIYSKKNKNILKSNLQTDLQNELDNELDNELQTELQNELQNELQTDLRNDLQTDLRNDLHNELQNELRNELHNDLHNELDNELRNELDNELRTFKAKSHWVFLCNVYSRVYLTWYYFINKELKVNTKHEKILKELYDLVNKTSILRCFFNEKYVLVLKTPTKIIRNDDSLHSINDTAIQFGNYGMYYVNGRRISKLIFDKVSNKTYTFDEFLKEPNEDIKSAVISLIQEKFGDEYLFSFISKNMTKVDTYINEKSPEYLKGTTGGMNVGVYTLFKGEIENNQISYVRCYCPSTDRMFFLGVENEYTSAKDAIASLYRIPKMLKNNIKYIQRQGERFSTVFDNDGNNMVKSMSKSEIQDTTTISGNDYFSKIRYEY